MAFGKRIKFFRNRKGMKQKELGELLGFLGKTSDVRVAQYETEARTPKADLVKEMAQIFGVSTRAINVPNIHFFIVTCTPSLHWKICMALRSEKLTENSASDLTGNTKNISICLNFFMHGSKWLQNWKPERSTRKNTIIGDITIRNWTPLKFGQKFRLRNSLTNSSRF